MEARAFWKIIVADRSDFLTRVIELLKEHSISFCILGGQAVNAYAEPVVSLDLDVVIGVDQITAAEALLKPEFHVERFLHSLNVSALGSDLRVQIQTDPRYAPFIERSAVRNLLGLQLPVASVEDVLQGKIWAALDAGRPPSKRQKDLADIARLIENFSGLRTLVPPELLTRLV
jgi:hypothetical protein